MNILNQVSNSIGTNIIKQAGVSAALTEQVASTTAIQASIQTTATIGAYTIAGFAVIPLNLFFGWITDNSDQIFQNAKYQFIPQRPSEEIVSEFEYLDNIETKDNNEFLIWNSVTFLSPIPELEAGVGYIYSWVTLPSLDDFPNTKFFIQKWDCFYTFSYRVVCSHFEIGYIVPLIACVSEDDAVFVLKYLNGLNLEHSQFLCEISKNFNYLETLLRRNELHDESSNKILEI